LTFRVGKNYKLIDDNIKIDYFYLLIETTNQFGHETFIDFYKINLGNALNDSLKPSQSLKIEVYTFKRDSLLENATVTSVEKNNYLVHFYNSILTYIDLKTKVVLFTIDFFKRDLNLEYFLSPTNLFSNKLKNLTSIKNTHNTLALNNLGDLVLIKFEKHNNYKIIKSSSSNNGSIKFESFKMNENKLIAYDKINSKLYGFNLDQILAMNSFDRTLFQIDVINMNLFGFSIDCRYFFTIENKKKLKFYDMSRVKNIAEIFLYFDAQIMVCSSDYLTIAVKDKRIISYMIMDYDNIKESYNKLRCLESRSVLLRYYCSYIQFSST